jgi:hypothetical protein
MDGRVLYLELQQPSCNHEGEVIRQRKTYSRFVTELLN